MNSKEPISRKKVSTIWNENSLTFSTADGETDGLMPDYIFIDLLGLEVWQFVERTRGKKDICIRQGVKCCDFTGFRHGVIFHNEEILKMRAEELAAEEARKAEEEAKEAAEEARKAEEEAKEAEAGSGAEKAGGESNHGL